jgi:predicted CopG family antitoxin
MAKRTVKIMTLKKTITIRKDVIEAIEKVAKIENRNFSNMMETMALEYLKNKPK